MTLKSMLHSQKECNKMQNKNLKELEVSSMTDSNKKIKESIS